jgi:hypothetical protein
VGIHIHKEKKKKKSEKEGERRYNKERGERRYNEVHFQSYRKSSNQKKRCQKIEGGIGNWQVTRLIYS